MGVLTLSGSLLSWSLCCDRLCSIPQCFVFRHVNSQSSDTVDSFSLPYFIARIFVFKYENPPDSCRTSPRAFLYFLKCLSFGKERVWCSQNESYQSVTGFCTSYTQGLSHEYLSLVMPQLVAVAWCFLKAVINRKIAKQWACQVWWWCVPCAWFETEFSNSKMVLRIKNFWWGRLPEVKQLPNLKASLVQTH